MQSIRSNATNRIAFAVSALVVGAAFAAPASAATLSVGSGKTYATPCKAFAAAKTGDVVEITGNTAHATGGLTLVRTDYGVGQGGWRTPCQGDSNGWVDLILVRDARILFAELKSDLLLLYALFLRK